MILAGLVLILFGALCAACALYVPVWRASIPIATFLWMGCGTGVFIGSILIWWRMLT